MKILLDWDNIAFAEAERRIWKILRNMAVKSLELVQSPSMSGYHIIISTYYPMNEVFIYRLRRAWKDDGKRITEDVLFKTKAHSKNVMFDKKIYGNYIQESVPMYLYKRIGHTETWQRIPLKASQKEPRRLLVRQSQSSHTSSANQVC